MTDLELAALLDEFKGRHEAGKRPDPADYLERAGASAGDLAALLDAYLAAQRAPALSKAELDQVAFSPLFDPPTWAELLVEARHKNGMLRSDVVARLTAALGLREEQGPSVAERLHELETGQLPPRRVSQRVIDAFDGIFRGIGAALDRTRLLDPPPMQVIASPAFTRDAAASVMTPDYAPTSDPEVDALFFGRED